MGEGHICNNPSTGNKKAKYILIISTPLPNDNVTVTSFKMQFLPVNYIHSRLYRNPFVQPSAKTADGTITTKKALRETQTLCDGCSKASRGRGAAKI